MLNVPLSSHEGDVGRGSRLGLPSCPAVVKREREDMKLQAATVVSRVDKEVTKEEPPADAACTGIYLSQ